MALIKTFLVSVSLIACCTAAFAFQEQTSGAQPAPAADARPADKSVDVTAPAVDTKIDAKRAVGTEVLVPGFGKLGVLPKMDFGLELLYGASEQKRPDATAPREDNRDDLTIRGSVKHTF